MTRPVTCVGYYGNRNAGDDAFVLAASRLAASEWHRPVWFTARELPVGAQGRALLGPQRIAGSILTGSSAVSSHVVHFGGSTMQDMSAARRRLRAMNTWRLCRLQALGVSVGPFATVSDETAVVEYLTRFDRIVVRDLASMTFCRQSGLECTLGLDPALLLNLPDSHGREANGRRATLGVVIAETGSAKVARPHEPENRLVNLVKIIAKLGDTPAIRVICLNPQDVPVAKRLMAEMAHGSARRMPEVLFAAYTGDPIETMRVIGECDALVTVRLHGAVFAYMCGVPFIVADYHEKCRSFATTVGAPAEWVADSDFSDVKGLSTQVDRMLSGRVAGPALGRQAAHVQARAAYAGTLESWNGGTRVA